MGLLRLATSYDLFFCIEYFGATANDQGIRIFETWVRNWGLLSDRMGPSSNRVLDS